MEASTEKLELTGVSVRGIYRCLQVLTSAPGASASEAPIHPAQTPSPAVSSPTGRLLPVQRELRASSTWDLGFAINHATPP